MNDQGVRQLVRYIEYTCWTTLTSRQSQRLEHLRNIKHCSIRGLRSLYKIAIDNYVFPECPYCKQSITTSDDLTIDHFVPKAHGGQDNLENLQPMHKECNSLKGCSMPEITECTEIPVKKHRKKRNQKKHKQRESVRSHSAEEMYQKCKKFDQARISKKYRGYSK